MKRLELVLVTLFAAAPAFADGVVKPNRTLPKFAPPKTTLEFSENPTVEEISRARAFEEPLVPIGGEPSAEENAALAAALLGYARRSGPDDFARLIGFLDRYPKSPWRAALLTALGSEYYNTAHYSLALEAWSNALKQPGSATSVEGMVVLARATDELASLYARLGRMTELEALLKLVEAPGASEKIKRAREALWLMQHQPEISFRCGPMALKSILKSDGNLLASCGANALMEIFNSASTQKGFSLSQVAELSRKIGLNYQMAFCGGASKQDAPTFVVPSVVHWTVGHYAALVQQVGDRYLLEDPTFGNSVWATRQALEAETSGYFLMPPGDLPPGWRSVDAKEGASVWGKGVTGGNDDDIYGPDDLQTGGSCSVGMPVASIHLMTANLTIVDTPLAYTPPVGPPVRFTIRHNSRESHSTDLTFGGYYLSGLTSTGIYDSVNDMPPESAFISPFTKMTHDWISYIIDSPQNPLANVKYVIGGGGARTFTGFDTNTQRFASQQYEQTLLHRTSPTSYEMIFPNGSKRIFSQPNGSIGSGRRVYLTQIADPAGNALTLTYDQDFKVMAVTDAIGQVTTLTYGDGALSAMLTRVTDPFGRSATFEYESRGLQIGRGTLRITTVNSDGTVTVTFQPILFPWVVIILTNITDTLGLSTQPQVDQVGGVFRKMDTPYGTTVFSTSGGGTNGNIRVAEISYPDGSRERVEYNQSTNTGLPYSEPVASVPAGIATFNQFIYARNTYYWSRTASASSYGDYSKAKIYHWLHTPDGITSAGILESTKEPLEGRVWYNYLNQAASFVTGANNLPTKIGRVLDDGQTQLQTQGYNSFGLLTNTVDPMGRAFSMLYATNGIDLLEACQTRGGNNELLFRASYNSQHLPLSVVDAAGQTNSFTYNSRGQRLTARNPKGEITTFNYDTNGYLTNLDGALPGTNDTVRFTYDSFGRVRTVTGVSLYMLTFDYDAMDRIIKITHPDNTFEEFIYDRLDLGAFRDRAGRETTFEHDNMRQVRKRTDPLNRVTLFDWCRCGQLASITDPMGRTTSWSTDVQGRRTAKHYVDGSEVSYQYENTTSRPHFVIDEKQQITQFVWNRDNTLRSIAYDSAKIPTPGVSFLYDPDYERVLSMTDGTGTTRYSYNPITSEPGLGAGALASIDGPLPNDTVTFGYDELGRVIHRAVGGVESAVTFDEAGRLTGVSNVLGAFSYSYDGASGRLISKSFPNGLVAERSYTNILQDLLLQRITHKRGAAPISEFAYNHDVSRNRFDTWSQQTGSESPDVFTFGYDSVNQLLSANVTNAGNLVNSFAYSYDPAANRLTEQIGASNSSATYNGLNQIRTTTAPEIKSTNEWDSVDRLVAVNVGTERSEFTYDGASRMTSIRKLVNGSEVSFRRFLWCGDEICEERDASGTVTKRFFSQGMKVESGPSAGIYFYTRDHVGSVREVTDSNGNVRARYSYDPYGRRTKLSGDIDADFGFAGMLFSAEANLAFTHYRAYDPKLGRWLSRDPLPSAEVTQGPNLYVYVANEPVSRIDPEGLCWGTSLCACFRSPAAAAACINAGIITVQQALDRGIQVVQNGVSRCAQSISTIGPRIASLEIRYEQLRPVLRYDWDKQARSLRELPAGGWLLPLWTNDMIELEQEFASIVELLQTELGIGAEEAWLLLATRLGWNPNAWTTWKPFGTW